MKIVEPKDSKVRYSVAIEGIHDYLMHKFTASDGSSKRGEHPTPEQDMESALYRNEKGVICVPALQIEASMLKASSELKFVGRRTYKDLVSSGITVEPELIPIKPQEYVQFEVAVRIQNAKILKSRPRFKNWSLEFRIVNSDPGRITDEKVRQILEIAGDLRGIGDWRPKFGTFRVVKFERAEDANDGSTLI